MLDYFDRHLIHAIAIYRYLQHQGRINDFIEVSDARICFNSNEINLLCVHKDREYYSGLFPLENSPLESFICGIKLFGSEMGFTVNNDPFRGGSRPLQP